ncbi:MAG: SMP-30/gluconolactonase/LRE family protein [Zavarzinella sp.]
MKHLLPLMLLFSGIPTLDSAEVTAPGAKMVQVGTGYSFTEGPAVDKDGNVYFTDQPGNVIWVWTTDGKLNVFLENAGRSNGLYVDANNYLWACADAKNELWKIDLKTKKIEVLVREFEGKLLNGPNDVWVHPKGFAYFTDPLYKRPYWNRGPQEQKNRGLYLFSTDKKLAQVDGDFVQPNGVVGSADGKTLYVADINAGKTYSYPIGADGTVGKRSLFCTSGSDGMTVDSEGNVYLTSAKVLVFDKSGKKIQEIAVPERPANVCFGGKDRKTLFITARKGFYSIEMAVSGAK